LEYDTLNQMSLISSGISQPKRFI